MFVCVSRLIWTLRFVYIKPSVTNFTIQNAYINEIMNHVSQVKERKYLTWRAILPKNHFEQPIAMWAHCWCHESGLEVFTAYFVRQGGPAKHIRHGWLAYSSTYFGNINTVMLFLLFQLAQLAKLLFWLFFRVNFRLLHHKFNIFQLLLLFLKILNYFIFVLNIRKSGCEIEFFFSVFLKVLKNEALITMILIFEIIKYNSHICYWSYKISCMRISVNCSLISINCYLRFFFLFHGINCYLQSFNLSWLFRSMQIQSIIQFMIVHVTIFIRIF